MWRIGAMIQTKAQFGINLEKLSIDKVYSNNFKYTE